MFTIQITGFLSYCKEQLGLSDNSLRAYRQDLNAFSKFCAQTCAVCQTPQDLILAYQRYLRDVSKASPATIRRRFVTLRSYCKWFESEPGGQPNPFVGLRLDLKLPQRLPRPVDRPTLSVLFTASRHATDRTPDYAALSNIRCSPDHVTGLVLRLLIVTGLRIGEITHLRVWDVSSACSRIRVRGKGNRERTVYVTNARLLRDFRLYWERRIDCGDGNDFLFLNTHGERLTEAAFRKRLRVISKALAIEPYLTPHRFRHSAATLLIEEGVDIRIVQRLLGHASISTTEIYTKVSDNSLVSAIERADTLAQVDC